jgi:2-keto-3-deoxy-L-rhamnonate aldolase RhmA
MNDGAADLGIRPNRMKQILAAGGFVTGTWVFMSRNNSVVRILAEAGLDFVFIDMEHSSLSFESVADHCEMARACGLTPIVRPYGYDTHLVNRIQDIGAMGLLYHDVATRAQVEQLHRQMMYPPVGTRGNFANGAPMDYKAGAGAQIKQFINENTLLAVQIESREGVENIDDILSTGVVDLVQVGRGDLSTSFGIPLDYDNPLIDEALHAVAAACNKHGVALGVNSRDADEARELVRMGMRSLCYASDNRVLLNTYRAVNQTLRVIVAEETGGRVKGREFVTD